MAISCSHLTGGDGGSSSPVTTASISPSAGDLVFVVVTWATQASTYHSADSCSGAGITWTRLTYFTYASRRFTHVYVGISDGTSGALTLSFTPSTSTIRDVLYTVDAFSGADVSGTPYGTLYEATGAGVTSASVTISETPDTGDWVACWIGVENAGVGLTINSELDTEQYSIETGSDVRSIGFGTDSSPDSSPTPGWTWTGSCDYGICGLIINVASAGTTYYQSCAGAITPAGAPTKKAKKPLAGVSNFAGIVSRKAARSLAGALSSAGNLAKKTDTSLAGGISFEGAISTLKLYVKALAGAIGFDGVVVGKAKKVLTGSLTSAGNLNRKTARSLSGVWSGSGDIAKKIGKALAGALTSAGNVARKVARSLAGAWSSAGNLATQFISGGGTVFYQSVSGAITFVGSQSGKALKLLTGNLTATGEIARTVSRALFGNLVPGGELVKKTGRALAGVLGTSGTLTRKIKKVLAGAWSAVGALIAALVGDFTPQTITGTVYVNISPAVSVFANYSPAVDVFANPTPAGSVEIG